MKLNPFLKEIAAIILDQDRDPASLCVVFPNKRARLYLSRYIGEMTSKPVWAPKYFTISELMEKISGYQIPDKLSLLFTLYDAYSKTTASEESFDTFYTFGETLLSDFDEIDKYLVDADDLFQNLSDLKNLDGRFNYLSDEQLQYIRKFWSVFNTETLSEGQNNFLTLWEKLPSVYKEFRNSLNAINMAYEGMAYRKAIEEPSNIDKVFDSDTVFFFIGFNALSNAEERLFMMLKNRGKAKFYWDFDTEYLDPVHEAGTFIRPNILKFPDSSPLNHKHFDKEKQKVIYVPVYSNAGQALILPDLIKKLEISETSGFEKTAIVLADEGLLTNVLYAIPEEIKDINVTMGYPVSDSAIYSLIDSLYELNKNSRTNKAGNTIWYFSDLMAVMNNPLLRRKYYIAAEQIRQFALEKHMVFISLTEAADGFTEDPVFNHRLRTDTVNYLLELVTGLLRENVPDRQKESQDPVHLELLFNVFTWLTRLNDILVGQSVKPSSDTLFRLIRKMLRSMRIPFNGEPLAGLQVLGILETRTLDFDNLILISANEGTLPGSSDRPSFIPFNLRGGFGMPTAGHHDAIYAYYFYRLIQRAQKIALVYDASSGGLKTGERSRFLHQLLYDMKMNVEEIQVASIISKIPVKQVVITKSPDIVQMLSAYFEGKRALSPSAINEYLNCPVKFYFHYIAGLKQPEDVSEDVDARLFGSLIHNSLRRIYELPGNEIITADRIRKIMEDDELIFKIIDQSFCEELFDDKDGSGNRQPEGYNLIVRQVIFTYIKEFLKSEARSVPFTLVSLEKEHYISMPLKSGGLQKNVKIGGVIDRIDLKNGMIRILDYKTGDAKNKFSSVESLFTNEKVRNDAVFQVFLYCLIYKKLNPESDLVPGLFFLRQCQQENFSAHISMDSKRIENFSQVEEEFEERLGIALEELFNKNIPFIQTTELKTCGYCAYAGICRR